MIIPEIAPKITRKEKKEAIIYISYVPVGQKLMLGMEKLEEDFFMTKEQLF